MKFVEVAQKNSFQISDLLNLHPACRVNGIYVAREFQRTKNYSLVKMHKKYKVDRKSCECMVNVIYIFRRRGEWYLFKIFFVFFEFLLISLYMWKFCLDIMWLLWYDIIIDLWHICALFGTERSQRFCEALISFAQLLKSCVAECLYGDLLHRLVLLFPYALCTRGCYA